MGRKGPRTRTYSHLQVSLDKFLANKNLWRKPIAKDGSCLFRAVAEQVLLSQVYHHRVRLQCADYIQRHKDDFKEFLTIKMESYLKQLRDGRLWGGEMELVVFSKLYRRSVVVFNQQEKGVQEQVFFSPEEEALGVSQPEDLKNPIVLAYTDGNHYDSVYTKKQKVSMGFCQSVLYSLLYERVLKDPLSQATKNRLKTLYDSEVQKLPSEKGDKHLAFLSKTYPVEVLEGMGHNCYSNIPLYVYQRERATIEQKDRSVAASIQFQVGDKCLIPIPGEPGGAGYKGQIASTIRPNGCHMVFIYDVGEQWEIPCKDITVPPSSSGPSPPPTAKHPSGPPRAWSKRPHPPAGLPRPKTSPEDPFPPPSSSSSSSSSSSPFSLPLPDPPLLPSLPLPLPGLPLQQTTAQSNQPSIIPLVSLPLGGEAPNSYHSHAKPPQTHTKNSPLPKTVAVEGVVTSRPSHTTTGPLLISSYKYPPAKGGGAEVGVASQQQGKKTLEVISTSDQLPQMREREKEVISSQPYPKVARHSSGGASVSVMDISAVRERERDMILNQPYLKAARQGSGGASISAMATTSAMRAPSMGKQTKTSAKTLRTTKDDAISTPQTRPTGSSTSLLNSPTELKFPSPAPPQLNNPPSGGTLEPLAPADNPIPPYIPPTTHNALPTQLSSIETSNTMSWDAIPPVQQNAQSSVHTMSSVSSATFIPMALGTLGPTQTAQGLRMPPESLAAVQLSSSGVPVQAGYVASTLEHPLMHAPRLQSQSVSSHPQPSHPHTSHPHTSHSSHHPPGVTLTSSTLDSALHHHHQGGGGGGQPGSVDTPYLDSRPLPQSSQPEEAWPIVGEDTTLAREHLKDVTLSMMGGATGIRLPFPAPFGVGAPNNPDLSLPPLMHPAALLRPAIPTPHLNHGPGPIPPQMIPFLFLPSSVQPQEREVQTAETQTSPELILPFIPPPPPTVDAVTQTQQTPSVASVGIQCQVRKRRNEVGCQTEGKWVRVEEIRPLNELAAEDMMSRLKFMKDYTEQCLNVCIAHSTETVASGLNSTLQLVLGLEEAVLVHMEEERRQGREEERVAREEERRLAKEEERRFVKEEERREEEERRQALGEERRRTWNDAQGLQKQLNMDEQNFLQHLGSIKHGLSDPFSSYPLPPDRAGIPPGPSPYHPHPHLPHHPFLPPSTHLMQPSLPINPDVNLSQSKSPSEPSTPTGLEKIQEREDRGEEENIPPQQEASTHPYPQVAPSPMVVPPGARPMVMSMPGVPHMGWYPYMTMPYFMPPHMLQHMHQQQMIPGQYPKGSPFVIEKSETDYNDQEEERDGEGRMEEGEEESNLLPTEALKGDNSVAKEWGERRGGSGESGSWGDGGGVGGGVSGEVPFAFPSADVKAEQSRGEKEAILSEGMFGDGVSVQSVELVSPQVEPSHPSPSLSHTSPSLTHPSPSPVRQTPSTTPTGLFSYSATFAHSSPSSVHPSPSLTHPSQSLTHPSQSPTHPPQQTTQTSASTQNPQSKPSVSERTEPSSEEKTRKRNVNTSLNKHNTSLNKDAPLKEEILSSNTDDSLNQDSSLSLSSSSVQPGLPCRRKDQPNADEVSGAENLPQKTEKFGREQQQKQQQKPTSQKDSTCGENQKDSIRSDSKTKETDVKETVKRNPMQRETSHKDATQSTVSTQKDGGQRDTSRKVSTQKEMSHRDSSPRETGTRETNQRELYAPLREPSSFGGPRTRQGRGKAREMSSGSRGRSKENSYPMNRSYYGSRRPQPPQKQTKQSPSTQWPPSPPSSSPSPSPSCSSPSSSSAPSSTATRQPSNQPILSSNEISSSSQQWSSSQATIQPQNIDSVSKSDTTWGGREKIVSSTATVRIGVRGLGEVEVEGGRGLGTGDIEVVGKISGRGGERSGGGGGRGGKDGGRGGRGGGGGGGRSGGGGEGKRGKKGGSKSLNEKVQKSGGEEGGVKTHSGGEGEGGGGTKAGGQGVGGGGGGTKASVGEGVVGGTKAGGGGGGGGGGEKSIITGSIEGTTTATAGNATGGSGRSKAGGVGSKSISKGSKSGENVGQSSVGSDSAKPASNEGSKSSNIGAAKMANASTSMRNASPASVASSGSNTSAHTGDSKPYRHQKGRGHTQMKEARKSGGSPREQQSSVQLSGPSVVANHTGVPHTTQQQRISVEEGVRKGGDKRRKQHLASATTSSVNHSPKEPSRGTESNEDGSITRQTLIQPLPSFKKLYSSSPPDEVSDEEMLQKNCWPSLSLSNDSPPIPTSIGEQVTSLHLPQPKFTYDGSSFYQQQFLQHFPALFNRATPPAHSPVTTSDTSVSSPPTTNL